MTDRTANFSGRQYPLVAHASLSYSDLVEDRVDQIFQLPAGARITDVILQVVTAFDNTTPVISVGLYSHSTTDPDNLLDAVSIATGDETFQTSLRSADEEAALDASDANVLTEADEIAILYAAAAGTATAGQLELYVEYIIDGRSNENSG